MKNRNKNTFDADAFYSCTKNTGIEKKKNEIQEDCFREKRKKNRSLVCLWMCQTISDTIANVCFLCRDTIARLLTSWDNTHCIPLYLFLSFVQLLENLDVFKAIIKTRFQKDASTRTLKYHTDNAYEKNCKKIVRPEKVYIYCCSILNGR